MTDFADLIGAIAQRLYGEPTSTTRDELRFRSRGSLSVKIGGPSKGTFFDHEAGVGGGVLDLIASSIGGERREATAWIRAEFPDQAGEPEASSARRVAALYPYHDERGELVFEVVRYDPKDFRQRRPDGRGGVVWNLKSVEPVPYHLPDLIEAIALERTIFVVEGEKDVDRLKALGVPATCNAGGAGKWPASLSRYFAGASVVILPDNDEPGRKHAEAVALALNGVASDVRILALPGLSPKGDVSDWFASGRTVEDLQRLSIEAPAARSSRLPAVWYGEEDNAPPLAWLAKGLLTEGGLSTVFGGPGTTKTFLVLDFALHVAHGRDWFDRPVSAGGVVYVSGEGGAGVRQRMKAWRQEKGGAARAPFVLVPSSINLFDGAEGVDILVADVRDHQAVMETPVRLVVLDTLSRMIGSGDEDRARDINVVVQKAEHIQKETGAHVMIVHHSGKDRDRGMRGSNALLGAVDTAIELTRYESGICEAKAVKIKDGDGVDPFCYRLSSVTLGADDEGDPITSCVVEPVGDSPGCGRARPKLSDREEIARRCLAELLADESVTRRVSRRDIGVTPCVTVEQWREAVRDQLSDEGDSTFRKIWERTRNALIRRAFVGTEGGLVWLA